MSGRRKITITLDTEGFEVDSHDEKIAATRISWNSVTGAIAYKRNLFAYDLICLGAEVNWDSSIELDEQMEGWDAFCRSFQMYVAESVPFEEWYAKVILPPFKTCETHVYRRDRQSATP